MAFAPVNIVKPAHVNNQGIRVRHGKSGALHDVIVLQRHVLNVALDSKTKASDLANLAKAWDCLEDRKRILRGKPLPGQYRPDDPKVKKIKSQALAMMKRALVSDEDGPVEEAKKLIEGAKLTTEATENTRSEA